MPLPPYIITQDIHEFVKELIQSMKQDPSILKKDISDIYQMFRSKYYGLSESQQFELDDCITKELLDRYCQYEEAVSVHTNYIIPPFQGTYYRMDPENESGYFVTSSEWYIVVKYEEWELFPTHQRIHIENKGVVRIYE